MWKKKREGVFGGVGKMWSVAVMGTEWEVGERGGNCGCTGGNGVGSGGGCVAIEKNLMVIMVVVLVEAKW